MVKPGSRIEPVAGLKGRKVAFGKGTSANNLVVAGPEKAGPENAAPENAGLEKAGPENAGPEKAGLANTDIETVYLSPADGAAAFAAGKVDARAVWDPFLAIAEVRAAPKLLARTADVLDVNTCFLANGQVRGGEWRGDHHHAGRPVQGRRLGRCQPRQDRGGAA